MRTRLAVPAVTLFFALHVFSSGVLFAQADLRLVNAAKDKNWTAVKALLIKGVDVNAKAADGSTALLWASHWANHEVVEELLRAHADVNSANDFGVTPLVLACENADARVVDLLLGADADVNHGETSGVTPLMVASRSGNPNIVKALVSHRANINATIPGNGQTALMWATSEAHRDVMEMLIGAGADVHSKSRIGFTPFLFAARNGDIEGAQILMRAGTAVNEVGSDGTHALPLAIISGHVEFAKFLLRVGADATGQMGGVTALHAAAGPVEMWLRDWLRARDVDYGRSTMGITPADRIELVRALVAHGADPNARITASTGVQGWLTLKRGAFEPFSVGTGDLKGATPLWVAAFDMHGQAYGGFGAGSSRLSQRPELIRTLLEFGADPTIATDDGSTVLMAAAGLGHGTYLPGQKRGARTPDAEEAVKILVDVAKVDVNARNEAGFTALHGAAFRGLNEVVEYLVDHGANLNVQDFMQRTPYRLAEGSKQTFQFQEWPETAELLKKLGADTSLGISGREQERQRDAAGSAVGNKPRQ